MASSPTCESELAFDKDEVLRCEICDMFEAERDPLGERGRGGGLKVLLLIMEMVSVAAQGQVTEDVRHRCLKSVILSIQRLAMLTL